LDSIQHLLIKHNHVKINSTQRMLVMPIYQLHIKHM